MPDQKPLKERIAALKAKRNAISREAKVRVASSFTVAKTMMPKDTPMAVISVIAKALCTIPDTKVLTAAVKQTAVNNFYTHIAEQLSDVHKVEMNDLLEKPEVLSKLKSELESEMKGGAKSATTKKADDRSECGVQPETYVDPSIGITPPEMDASKAGERKEDTVNKSLGDKKEAAAKKACACGTAGCAECKKASEATPAAETKEASAKKADEIPPADAPPADAPAGEAPAGDEAPVGEEAPMGDEAPAGDGETEGEIVLDGEKKEDIKADIADAKQSIEHLQEAIDEASNESGEELMEMGESDLNPAEDDIDLGDDALDIENIFSDDNLNEHKGALANEHEASGEEITFDNEPTSAEKMEAALEGGEDITSASDFFSSDDEGSSLDILLGAAHTATSVDGSEVIPSFSGEAAEHFRADELGGDDVDAESDHDEDIFGDVLKSLKPEDYNVGKPREQEPEQKAPEAVKGGKISTTASKTAAKVAPKPIRRLKVSAPTAKEVKSLSSLLFTDEEDYR